ncbi:PDZ domain-containing protein [Helicobacter sp. 13S00477-4]|uniref:DUF7488 domain-containing protein n=1 Tax=Helicobacter sp. 13S00477-4 TaxID=1905759 RepID=UPI000BA72445|nr:PDZ domain-containing protein [Helicobacter sp. 13S00477-4]PAF50568.1 hypothetical protein BKH44_07710 [Helicobacter sp. 13S00477-4]
MPNLFLIVFVFFLIVSNLFSYDFSHCVNYYQEATTSLTNNHLVSIKNKNKNVSLMFSRTPPKGLKILKADPFVGLYIIQSNPTKYIYKILDIDSYAKQKELSAIGFKYSSKGKILKTQNGFTDYARFSTNIPINGVISNICYQIYGIGVGDNQFIDKKYIDRFLNQKTSYYGDIGIRAVQKDKYIIVRQVDPFFKNNPFLPGDVILSINGKTFQNYADFEWLVSNLPYQKPANIIIIRDNKKQSFNINTDKRYGGFLMPDTFLERFGIVLDKDLTIIQIDEDKQSNFKIGDRLIWIDRKPIIKNENDSFIKITDSLRSALSQAGIKNNIEVLVMRNGLELYLKI